jgi:hypothetical protein
MPCDTKRGVPADRNSPMAKFTSHVVKDLQFTDRKPSSFEGKISSLGNAIKEDRNWQAYFLIMDSHNYLRLSSIIARYVTLDMLRVGI